MVYFKRLRERERKIEKERERALKNHHRDCSVQRERAKV